MVSDGAPVNAPSCNDLVLVWITNTHIHAHLNLLLPLVTSGLGSDVMKTARAIHRKSRMPFL